MLVKEILNRRSVREYKTEAVPEEYLIEIVKAGQFAPTARNNRAIEFIVVKEQKMRDNIFEIVGQEFIREASILIIPVSDTLKTDFPIQDLSAATENMFLQATSLGLGTVWKNLQPEWLEKIKKLLGIPQNFIAINIIPVGYLKGDCEPYNDNDFDAQKIHKERW